MKEFNYQDMDEVYQLCKGNPGALNVIMESLAFKNGKMALGRMLENCITGDKLYMLWNDCCNRDTRQAVTIMRYGSIEEIQKHINYSFGRGYEFSDEQIQRIQFKAAIFDGQFAIYKGSNTSEENLMENIFLDRAELEGLHNEDCVIDRALENLGRQIAEHIMKNGFFITQCDVQSGIQRISCRATIIYHK